MRIIEIKPLSLYKLGVYEPIVINGGVMGDPKKMAENKWVSLGLKFTLLIVIKFHL